MNLQLVFALLRNVSDAVLCRIAGRPIVILVMAPTAAALLVVAPLAPTSARIVVAVLLLVVGVVGLVAMVHLRAVARHVVLRSWGDIVGGEPLLRLSRERGLWLSI